MWSMDAALVSTPKAFHVPSKLPRRAASRFAGKKIHFIGIGGCGMSGLARMLLDDGALISGSELKPNSTTFDLIRRGVKISRDQLGELLASDLDLVVRSAAVRDDNCEFMSAKALEISTVKYSQLLGMVMKERFGIAVAGTHGKSTTSAMISYVLLQCGADPSFVIGGTVPQLGGGSRSGKADVFVAEACEFDRSFHNLHPKIAVITNIEEDHLDCYKDIHEIMTSFRKFAELAPKDGLIIGSGDDARVIRTLSGQKCRIELAALSPGFIWSTRFIENSNGCPVGELRYKEQPLGTLRLGIAGKHNLINATMAVAAVVACGISPTAAIEAINTFSGVDRRMTQLGQYNGATIVDDYGHHPTEIRVTLHALRERFKPRRLICVFQPHQHSRTRFLLEDFASSFTLADQTIVPDIYFVRDSEAERQSVSSADLVQRITANGQQAKYLPKFDEITDYLKTTATAGDLIVTMGAGNVWEIGRQLVDSSSDAMRALPSAHASAQGGAIMD
jgi:UDP-N-acetylmuramate--alanine ligase